MQPPQRRVELHHVTGGARRPSGPSCVEEIATHEGPVIQARDRVERREPGKHMRQVVLRRPDLQRAGGLPAAVGSLGDAFGAPRLAGALGCGVGDGRPTAALGREKARRAGVYAAVEGA